MAPIIYKDKAYTIVYDQRGIKKNQLARIPQLKGDSVNLVYNDLDLSRFPELSNDKVRAKLEAGQSLTELIINQIDLQKGGFINISGLWKGPRKGPGPQLRQFLDKHGDEAIIDLKLSKQPISNYLTRFLDVISLGRFSKTVDKLGYPAAYHTGLKVTTNKGSYLIERNHILEAKELKDKAKNAEAEDPNMINIDAKIPNNLTIRGMINTAATDNPNFWRYNPVSNNCQILVQDLLNKNNIDYNDVQIIQDAKEITDGMGPIKHVLQPITDVAATLDRVVYGEGRGKKKTMRKTKK